MLPQNYTQQVHFIDKRRGDVGKFTLEDGIHVRGRVVDVDGQPIAGVWVNARLMDRSTQVPRHIPVSDHIFRSALTDDEGQFELAPLPSARYVIAPEAVPIETPGNLGRRPHALPAAFEHREFNITAASELEEIELRAVPSAIVTVKFLDSNGHPTQGLSELFLGGATGQLHYSTKLFVDQNNTAVAHTPKGLKDVRIDIPYGHLSIRHRAAPNAPLSKNREIVLGTLDHDRVVEIIRYRAPTLIVDVKDAEGKPPTGVQVEAEYIKADPAGERRSHSVTRNVSLRAQPNGRWKSHELLPDEEFTLKVTADGYAPYAETRLMREGELAEISVTLEKSSAADEESSE
jgi:hypothetical protein